VSKMKPISRLCKSSQTRKKTSLATMKNQLILLVLCIIAVCLVSGNQKSNIAKLNSLIERTRKGF